MKPKKGRKRKSTSGSTSSTPVAKQPRFELTKQQLSLIKKDSMNKKLWEELLEATDTVSLVMSCDCHVILYVYRLAYYSRSRIPSYVLCARRWSMSQYLHLVSTISAR